MLNKLHIYHGSDHIIEKPVFGEGKLYNDYGRGFYCTEHIELSKEWACALGTDGYACHYQLNMEGLRVLHLIDSQYTILNWLAILLENRKFDVAEGLPQRARTYLLENFMVEYKKYDVIIDGLLPEEGVYVGRTYMDAPGIDGTVYVETTRTLMSGDIVPVRISGAEKYDLIGECIE